jgi:hypothetical protein
VNAEVVHISELAIGRSVFQDFDATAFDLKPVSDSIGRTISGVVGLSIAKSAILRIDFPRRTLQFAASAESLPPGATSIPMDLSADLPKIEILGEKGSVWATVSTASMVTLGLPEEEIRTLGSAETAIPVNVRELSSPGKATYFCQLQGTPPSPQRSRRAAPR